MRIILQDDIPVYQRARGLSNKHSRIINNIIHVYAYMWICVWITEPFHLNIMFVIRPTHLLFIRFIMYPSMWTFFHSYS